MINNTSKDMLKLIINVKIQVLELPAGIGNMPDPNVCLLLGAVWRYGHPGFMHL